MILFDSPLYQQVLTSYQQLKTYTPENKHVLKVNHGNTRKICEKCSKLTIKTPEGRY